MQAQAHAQQHGPRVRSPSSPVRAPPRLVRGEQPACAGAGSLRHLLCAAASLQLHHFVLRAVAGEAHVQHHERT